MPTSNFQPIRLTDPGCWYKITYLMANSEDPDQLDLQKPTDLDLHCLQRQGISGFGPKVPSEIWSRRCSIFFYSWKTSLDISWESSAGHLFSLESTCKYFKMSSAAVEIGTLRAEGGVFGHIWTFFNTNIVSDTLSLGTALNTFKAESYNRPNKTICAFRVTLPYQVLPNFPGET